MKKCTKCNISQPLDEFYYCNHYKKYKSRCKSCLKEYQNGWNSKNVESRSRYDVKSYEANREIRIARALAYAKNNPERTNEYAKKQYWDKLRRTPAWLTNADHIAMAKIYETARRLTAETGIKHEVDHILPMRGKDVSGLHVPSNLQILTKSENIKKRNKPVAIPFKKPDTVPG